MYLIFPKSMIIPEVADRREDNNFEDWLTATVIENANRRQTNGGVASSRGITDLWMLEIDAPNWVNPVDSQDVFLTLVF